ncbi:hypothetical protein CDD81_4674 [Ophiocordyceps australis]|uniref:Uncharacterized protein n=1 Tax=Ophiocordyceps australis TaxID=1399860 RepID=A0A2C5XVL7_9HYPO|nr:hypothetical protein CDD81_4674 [Ophiocordyceps australis]
MLLSCSLRMHCIGALSDTRPRAVSCLIVFIVEQTGDTCPSPSACVGKLRRADKKRKRASRQEEEEGEQTRRARGRADKKSKRASRQEEQEGEQTRRLDCGGWEMDAYAQGHPMPSRHRHGGAAVGARHGGPPRWTSTTSLQRQNLDKSSNMGLHYSGPLFGPP